MVWKSERENLIEEISAELEKERSVSEPDKEKIKQLSEMLAELEKGGKGV